MTTNQRITQLLNQCKMEQQQVGQETENVSETSIAKQKREERMKKFDVELQTKMRLEQVLFKRRRLNLEMQMKVLSGGRA